MRHEISLGKDHGNCLGQACGQISELKLGNSDFVGGIEIPLKPRVVKSQLACDVYCVVSALDERLAQHLCVEHVSVKVVLDGEVLLLLDFRAKERPALVGIHLKIDLALEVDFGLEGQVVFLEADFAQHP